MEVQMWLQFHNQLIGQVQYVLAIKKNKTKIYFNKNENIFSKLLHFVYLDIEF